MKRIRSESGISMLGIGLIGFRNCGIFPFIFTIRDYDTPGRYTWIDNEHFVLEWAEVVDTWTRTSRSGRDAGGRDAFSDG